MPIIGTNIDHIIKSLRDSHYGMFKDSRLQDGMNKIGEKIQENTLASVRGGRGSGSKSYLSQTGRLYKLLGDEDQVEARMSEGNSLSMKVGYARIDEFNEGTKRRGQQARFRMPNGDEKSFKLRPEPELPSWIIMEFGRRPGNGSGSTGIPKQFKITYSGRDKEKKFLFGPSSTIHYKKPIFFMAKKEWMQEGYGKETAMKRHPGIQEKAFFRTGLKKTIPFIAKEIGSDIEMALERQLMARGWEVRYHY